MPALQCSIVGALQAGPNCLRNLCGESRAPAGHRWARGPGWRPLAFPLPPARSSRRHGRSAWIPTPQQPLAAAIRAQPARSEGRRSPPSRRESATPGHRWRPRRKHRCDRGWTAAGRKCGPRHEAPAPPLPRHRGSRPQRWTSPRGAQPRVPLMAQTPQMTLTHRRVRTLLEQSQPPQVPAAAAILYPWKPGAMARSRRRPRGRPESSGSRNPHPRRRYGLPPQRLACLASAPAPSLEKVHRAAMHGRTPITVCPV
mmetsp:Transcript_47160/g.131646  ORF Transcript_47160/g.131646 Transcript_47160/m.131646 type:complete len:256 (+) Transcript_47160:452-1219(+)